MNRVSQSMLGLAVVSLAVLALPNAGQAASFSRATLLGKSRSPGCGAGGFIDLTGQCWKCPKGYEHDNILLPPTHERVCRSGTRYSAGVRHARAAVGCPAGQWPSLHNGFCYACPAGFGHDLLRNGDDRRVCFKKQAQRVSYSKGIRRGRTVLGLGCPKGQWPSMHDGRCYTCPEGHRHDNARSGNDPRVCFRRTGGETLFRQGTRYGKSNAGLCPAGQFLSAHNMACYTCPGGYSQDILRSGDDGRVCFRKQETFSRATHAGGLLCERGFFDPINGGSCWSCPAEFGLRTVAPVNGARACTDRLDGIVAVDICTPILTAVGEGQKGLAAVESALYKIIGPATRPLNDVMQRLTPRVGTPAGLEALMDEVGERLRPFGAALEDVQRLGDQLERSGAGLRSLLLDPRVVCGGNPGEIDRRLAALGLRPNLNAREASLLDEWLVPTAHARSGRAHVAFFLAMNLLPLKEPGLPKSPINSIVLTVVTDFAGKAALFLSLGHAFSSNPSGGYSIGAFIFPSADIGDFDLVGSLGTEVSLNAGLAQRIWSKMRAKAPAGPSRYNFHVSFDPLFKEVPGFGVSREVYVIDEGKGGDTHLLDFGGISFDFTALLAGG